MVLARFRATCKAMLAALLLLAGVFPHAEWAKADGLVFGDFVYEDLGHGEAMITGYTGSDTNVDIPDAINGLTVTKIGTEAFMLKGLTNVKIPGTVTEIGEAAFLGNNLLSLEIPDSVTSIGPFAFANNVALQSLELSGSLTEIGSFAFALNQSLPTLEIPEGVTRIGDGAFYKNAALWSVKFPSTLTEIGNAAFAESSLISVTFPDGLTRIGEGAFYKNLLDEVEIPSGVTVIELAAFADNLLDSVKLPDGLTEIGDSAFEENYLTSVTIPDSVTRIGKWAFMKNRLSGVTIPDGITVIEEGAFAVNELASVTWPAGLAEIGPNAFESNLLEDVTIPAGVTRIGQAAFIGNALKSVTLKDGLIEIGPGAFADNELKNVTIPPSVTRIGEFAFYNNQLESVDIPPGVTKIETGAFSANKLISVTLPDGLTEIGDHGFSFNELASVTIPSGVTRIGEGAFGNNQLASLTIPDSVTEIGPVAFAVNKLAKVTIPGNITVIEDGVFSANELASVTIPDGVKKIGPMAFAVNQLTGVIVPESVEEIGEYAFGANPPLSFVVIENAGVDFVDSPAYSFDDFFDGNPVIVGYPGSSAEALAGAETLPFVDIRSVDIKTNGGTQWKRSHATGVEVKPPNTAPAYYLWSRSPDMPVLDMPPAHEDWNPLGADPVTTPGESGIWYLFVRAEIPAGQVSELPGGLTWVRRSKPFYVDTDISAAPVTPVPADTGTVGGGGPIGGVDPIVRWTTEAGAEKNLRWEDKLALSIPEGAVSESVMITVTEVTDLDALIAALEDNQTLVSAVLEILKDKPGVFNKPVTIAIRFDPSKVGENQTVSIFHYDEERQEWVDIGGTVEGEWVTATVDHFTKFAAIAMDLAEPAPAFTDIAGHWGESAILEAAARKLVTGYPDGTFRPEREVTRAEFLVMLARALGWEVKTPSGELPFAEADRMGTWAAGAVGAAVALGVAGGYPDGTFRPDASITRAEMAAMIARALGVAVDADGLTAFADDADIPAWAKGAVESLRQLGMIQGRGDGRFAPGGTATRAEAATVLLRIRNADN